MLTPPHLVFYADANNDDIPDGPPVVHLEGFGFEDTHSMANSLRWGPDGWLYGAQGSTVTAAIKRPGLDGAPIAHIIGQCIWRYHPESRRFEVFAEGGGNTFYVEIDAKGRTLVARTPAVALGAYPWGKAPKDVEAALKGNKKADLLAVSTWKVKPVSLPVQRVVYRVTTPDADQFNVPEDLRQRVIARTKDHVDVEVKAGLTSAGPLVGETKKRALSATPYEAVFDPRIQTAARDAVVGAKDDADKVKMLAAFVFHHVEKKSLDRGYAPAIATLESKAGDCTEHSVLLSALLRSQGLPTRIVDGVIVDGGNAGYHEWVEVNLGAGFVPVDPTFNAWPAGPERLKLAEGSTLPDEHLGLSLAAARLLKSGVKIEVLSAQ